MAESEGGSSNFLETFFVEVFKLIGELFKAMFSVIPKVLGFVLWIIVAIFILPCVFVAGHIYPLWVEWGEDF